MTDFISNRQGTCVTAEGLDRLLPRDDRPVDLTDSAYDILFTSKGTIIRDCAPSELTLEEQVAAEGIDLVRAVFDGPTIEPTLHTVPLGGSLPYLLAGVVAMCIAKWRARQ